MQARTPGLQRAAWDAFRREADLEATRNPDAAGYQPILVAGFCDAEYLEEARAFFEPRARKEPAMARPLAASLESIELCIAAVAAQRDQAAGVFTARVD
jgi:hypothetical protein